ERVPFPAGPHELVAQKLRRANLRDDLRLEVCARAEAEVLVRGAAKAVTACVRAAAVAVDRVVEAHVGAVVVRDDVARLGLLEDLDARVGRLSDPLDAR